MLGRVGYWLHKFVMCGQVVRWRDWAMWGLFWVGLKFVGDFWGNSW